MVNYEIVHQAGEASLELIDDRLNHYQTNMCKEDASRCYDTFIPGALYYIDKVVEKGFKKEFDVCVLNIKFVDEESGNHFRTKMVSKAAGSFHPGFPLGDVVVVVEKSDKKKKTKNRTKFFLVPVRPFKQRLKDEFLVPDAPKMVGRIKKQRTYVVSTKNTELDFS